MRAELLIDVMEMIPQRLGADVRVRARCQTGLSAFGEAARAPDVPARTAASPGRAAARSFDISMSCFDIRSIRCTSTSVRLRSAILRARCTIRRRPRLRIFVNQGGHVHPDPPARACFDLEIEVRDRLCGAPHNPAHDSFRCTRACRARLALGTAQSRSCQPPLHVQTRTSASALLFHEQISPPSVTANAASAVCSRKSKRSPSNITSADPERHPQYSPHAGAYLDHASHPKRCSSRDNHPIASNRWTIARPV